MTTAFHGDVLGVTPSFGPDELGAGFGLGSGPVPLILGPELSSVPGRAVPSHGARGAGHVAFAVAAGQLDAWRVSRPRARS